MLDRSLKLFACLQHYYYFLVIGSIRQVGIHTSLSNQKTLAKTQIGSDRREWTDKEYDAQLSTLFGSYSHYCHISGLQSKGWNNFSSDLIELCQQTLAWSDVQWGRDGQGRRIICGLKLRTYGNTALTVEDSLTTDDLSDDLKANPSNISDDSLTTLTTQNAPKLSDQKPEKNQITSSLDGNVALKYKRFPFASIVTPTLAALSRPLA